MTVDIINFGILWTRWNSKWLTALSISRVRNVNTKRFFINSILYDLTGNISISHLQTLFLLFFTTYQFELLHNCDRSCNLSLQWEVIESHGIVREVESHWMASRRLFKIDRRGTETRWKHSIANRVFEVFTVIRITTISP